MDGTVLTCSERTKSAVRSVFNKARETVSARLSPEARQEFNRQLMYLTPPRFAGMSLKNRLHYVRRQNAISRDIDCPHQDSHIVAFIKAFLSITSDVEGCIVEAGCYKGGGTAKFSLAAKSAGGTFAGTLDEVRNNVHKYGEIDVCQFVEGWFEDTLPNFTEPIAAAYIDVDLASSTRTCLKHIYPLLVPGGMVNPRKNGTYGNKKLCSSNGTFVGRRTATEDFPPMRRSGHDMSFSTQRRHSERTGVILNAPASF